MWSEFEFSWRRFLLICSLKQSFLKYRFVSKNQMFVVGSYRVLEQFVIQYYMRRQLIDILFFLCWVELQRGSVCRGSQLLSLEELKILGLVFLVLEKFVFGIVLCFVWQGSGKVVLEGREGYRDSIEIVFLGAQFIFGQRFIFRRFVGMRDFWDNCLVFVDQRLVRKRESIGFWYFRLRNVFSYQLGIFRLDRISVFQEDFSIGIFQCEDIVVENECMSF